MREKELLGAIEEEVDRVVGHAGVQVSLQTVPGGRPLARVEMAEAVWAMPPDVLLEMLREMPDRAGILALRQAADQSPSKVSCD